MCGGVLYQSDGESRRLFFPNQRATLPVVTRSGRVVQLAWGRRRGEPGALPFGGWARLEAIRRGGWERWFPTPVRLPLRGFMEQDMEGRSHWYTLTRGQFVQGLVARDGGERRVYVVTVEPERADALHARWPRLVAG